MKGIFLIMFEAELFWITILISFVLAKLSISKYKKIDNKSVSFNYSMDYYIKTTISKGYVDCILGCEQLDICTFVVYLKGHLSKNECFYYKHFPSEDQLIDSNESTIFKKSI